MFGNQVEKHTMQHEQSSKPHTAKSLWTYPSARLPSRRSRLSGPQPTLPVHSTFLALALALRPSRSLREDIDHLSSSASMDMDMNITGAMACVSCVVCVMRRLFELGPAEAES